MSNFLFDSVAGITTKNFSVLLREPNVISLLFNICKTLKKSALTLIFYATFIRSISWITRTFQKFQHFRQALRFAFAQVPLHYLRKGSPPVYLYIRCVFSGQRMQPNGFLFCRENLCAMYIFTVAGFLVLYRLGSYIVVESLRQHTVSTVSRLITEVNAVSGAVSNEMGDLPRTPRVFGSNSFWFPILLRESCNDIRPIRFWQRILFFANSFRYRFIRSLYVTNF